MPYHVRLSFYKVVIMKVDMFRKVVEMVNNGEFGHKKATQT